MLLLFDLFIKNDPKFLKSVLEAQGSPVYLFDKRKEKAICIYSIYLWHNGVSCGENGTMIHGRLSYYSQKNAWGLDRYEEGDETLIVSNN